MPELVSASHSLPCGSPGIVLILMVDPIKAIIFTVLIIVIQQFDGLYLGPRILGETVGLRPLWIIFAITVGGSIGGPLIMSDKMLK